MCLNKNCNPKHQEQETLIDLKQNPFPATWSELSYTHLEHFGLLIRQHYTSAMKCEDFFFCSSIFCPTSGFVKSVLKSSLKGCPIPPLDISISTHICYTCVHAELTHCTVRATYLSAKNFNPSNKTLNVGAHRAVTGHWGSKGNTGTAKKLCAHNHMGK